jgi:hypothetical protein
MRRTVRFPIVVVAVAVTLFSVTAASALAQGASQVRAGSEVEVANNGECRPDTEVALFFEGAGVAEVQVGSAVSDAAGSFQASVVIPADAGGGPAAILVDCGLDSAVLTYEVEVIGSGFSLGSLVGPVLVGLAVIALVGLVALLRRHRGKGGHDDDENGVVETVRSESSTSPLVMPAAPDEAPEAVAGAADHAPGAEHVAPAGPSTAAPSVPVLAAPQSPVAQPSPDAAASVTHGDDDHEDGGIDDGADYWFWEAATSAGPRRRVACMTETTFHLHEVSVDAFQPMLDRLVEVGPDAALAQAFVRIPVAAVDRVVREGTVLHIEGRSATGPRRQTIDLADGADGVVEMLARRLPVVDALRVQ